MKWLCHQNHGSPGPYAVMVWFHGGGYQSGGNIQYPGHFLSSDGVVVVIANYRLGILGIFGEINMRVIEQDRPLYVLYLCSSIYEIVYEYCKFLSIVIVNHLFLLTKYS